MSDFAAKEEKAGKEESSGQRRIRDIQKRDLMVVRHLMSDYPDFSHLNSEDQLDRIVLVLESICGYGAVSVETIGQLQSVFQYDVKDVREYFQTSQYNNIQTGEKKNKYRTPFEGAFRLEREFKKNLSEEGGESDSNEPIRKKVPKPKSSKPASQSRPMTVLQTQASRPSVQNMDRKKWLSTDYVDKNEDSSEKKSLPVPVLVGVSVAVIVAVVMIALIIYS